MLNKIIIGVTLLLVFAFLCSSCIMNGLSPCHVDPEIGTYTEEPMTVYTPYTSLWDAERLNRALGYKHLLNQEELKRLIEDDTYLYDFLTKDLSINMASAQELRDNIFSPASPIGALFPLGTGVVLGWLGLSAPDDKRKITALQNGNNKTA